MLSARIVHNIWLQIYTNNTGNMNMFRHYLQFEVDIYTTEALASTWGIGIGANSPSLYDALKKE